MFQNFKPARSAAEAPQNMKVLVDFDGFIDKSIGFKLKGKYYIINNITVENYMKVTLAYKNLLDVMSKRSNGEETDHEDVYETYFQLVSPLVPELTFAELSALPFPGLNQLLTLILRQIAGDPELAKEIEEKKNPQKPISSSMLNSSPSSPSSVDSTTGVTKRFWRCLTAPFLGSGRKV
jgi:hypothetical protein